MALYDEAVIDAQKLREVAENAAKQEILEAITPRIREMINARILSEQTKDQEFEDIDLDDEQTSDADIIDEPAENIDVEAVDSDEDFDIEADDADESDDETMQAMDSLDMGSGMQDFSSDKKSSVVINNTGDIHIGTNESKKMSNKKASVFESEAKKIRIAERINTIIGKLKLLDHNSAAAGTRKLNTEQKANLNNTYRKLVSEAIVLNAELSSCGGGSQRLERKLVSTLKEMKTMSNRTKKNIFDFLFEGEDKKSVARDEHKKFLHEGDEPEDKSEENDDEDEEEGEEEVDLGKIKDLVSQLQDALGGEEEDGESEDLDLGGDEEEGDEEDKELSLDEEDNMSELDDMEEEDMDEMYTEVEMDEMHTEADDMSEEELQKEADDCSEDEMQTESDIYEIDEAALRRELGKMKKIRETRSSRARKIRENAASEKADQFGGAEELGDVFYDIDEDKLINILADELGSVKQMPKVGGHSSKHESAAARKAMKEAAEYKQAAQQLQAQLVEMNLFNAKLLYANKLMQNKNLTVKQQRAIVEALDNAKTLREAKLLYKSLSESLARRGQESGTLREGATRTVLGSSSRSTRSAQPAKSGVEVDRWATLAGIKG